MPSAPHTKDTSLFSLVGTAVREPTLGRASAYPWKAGRERFLAFEFPNNDPLQGAGPS